MDNLILDLFTCRICLETDNQNDLISPCSCSGTSKYVHRTCLNQWRAMDINPRSMTHCTECNYEYQIHNPVDIRVSHFKKINLFLASHSPIFSFINFFFFIFLFNFIVSLDKDKKLLIVSDDNRLSLFNYYLITLIVFLFSYFVIFGINTFFQRNRNLYLTYYFSAPWQKMIITLIISIILFFIGYIIAIAFFTVLLQLFIKHHYKVVKRIEITNINEVIDLDEIDS